MKTTFEYKDSKSYTELTNSIRELIQNLDSAEKTLGRSNTHVANLLSELASLYDDPGDYAQAMRLNQWSLSILEESLGSQHMDVADVLNDLAWEYREIGDYGRALTLFQRSLVVTEKLVGSEHVEVTVKPARYTAGQDARLYGRQDARRYAEQIRASTGAPEAGALPVTPSARVATRVCAATATFP